MKNWLKNGVFWAKIAVFGEKISVFGNGSSVEGGGVPPFSVNFFPLTFRKILVRGGPGGGGYPPNGKFPCLGFLNPSLTRTNFNDEAAFCCYISTIVLYISQHPDVHLIH